MFIAPPSINELKKRLLERKTESKKTINNRLKVADWEIAQSKKYQNVLVNKNNKSKEKSKKLRQLIIKAMKKHKLW